LADRKSEIFDEDILALVSEESVAQGHEQFSFVSLAQHSETGEQPQATVVMNIGGKEVTATANGNGPVDASLKAIEANVTVVLKWCCIRSTPSVDPPRARVRSRCACKTMGVS
jgi:hypothetical protein